MDNKSRIQQNRLLAAFQTAISPLITVFSQFFGVKFSLVCLNLLLLLSSCRPEPSPLPETFIPVPAVVRGADLSFLPEMRLAVTDFKNTQGEVEDPLKTLSVAGMNIIRLRLWHQPEGKYSLREAIAIAQEAKLMNLPLWISLHYSDTWADPGSQTKPTQWHNIDFELLKDSIYHYTYRVASTLQPAILQIGNEINQGILWPEGHISQHSQMSALLAEGIRGCRNASPQTKIMLHYAGLSGAYVFFGNLLQLDYDYIGLSYYPIWHGKSLAETGSVVQELKNTFAKDVLIAETSYPFTFEWPITPIMWWATVAKPSHPIEQRLTVKDHIFKHLDKLWENPEGEAGATGVPNGWQLMVRNPQTDHRGKIRHCGISTITPCQQ